MALETSDHPTQLGNYEILSRIAEGGMGTVYKAKHRGTGDIVAIKVIAQGTTRNPVILQRFEREFVAAKVLDHPNVVRAIEYCGIGPHPFLVMEFVDGESLGQRVERAGPIPEAEAVGIMVQVCDGLQRAHKQGLVHRDVKPDNILITREGIAKLTDMGLVKDIENDLNLTKTGRGLGTPHFMAPEQFRNAKGVDVRGDIYSLGATLYAMVTGTTPFDLSNPLDCWMKKIRNEFPAPREINPKVSERVDWAIRRAMSAEPSQRPSSCREFIEDLTGQSRGSGPVKPTEAAPADIWYLVYRDETGQSHTVKGATDGIRKALAGGLLGDASTILIGRSKTGQFVPLHSMPEFRDLVVSPSALPGSGAVASAVARRSGAVPAPTAPRPPAGIGSDNGVDLGALPLEDEGASNRGGSRPVPVPRLRQTPTSPPVDPRAETAVHGEPVSAHTPLSTPIPERRAYDRDHQNREQPKKPFDLTPILMILVAILSAAVGYLLITR